MARRRILDCRIGQVREAIGLTRCQMARDLGMMESLLWGIEQGHGLTVTTALKIAAYLRKPVGELWLALEKADG